MSEASVGKTLVINNQLFAIAAKTRMSAVTVGRYIGMDSSYGSQLNTRDSRGMLVTNERQRTSYVWCALG